MKNLLNRILDESNISHAQFAKDLGVAKSYVLTMLNGKKLISENTYKKMLKLDYVAPYSSELSELYFRHKIGNESYELMAHFLTEAKNFSFEPKVLPPAYDPLTFSVCLGQDELIPVISGLLGDAIRSGREFFTNYPFSMTELDEAVYATAKGRKLYSEKIIHHTVFHSGVLDKALISAYWRALRWSSAKVVTDICFAPYAPHPYPYYAVSGDVCVSFSENGGYITDTAGVAKDHIDFHNGLEKHPFVSVIHDETELLTNTGISTGKELMSFESILCPYGIYDYDMLMETTTEGVPAEVKEMLINAFLNYYNFNERFEKFVSFVQVDAVYEWLKNGREYTVSKNYLNSFSPENRKKAVGRLAEFSSVRLIRKDKINLPKCYGFDAYDRFLDTHLIFTDDNIPDYEVFCHCRYSTILGLEMFVKNLFYYLEYEFTIYSDADKKSLLKQLSILGDFNL